MPASGFVCYKKIASSSWKPLQASSWGPDLRSKRKNTPARHTFYSQRLTTVTAAKGSLHRFRCYLFFFDFPSPNTPVWEACVSELREGTRFCMSQQSCNENKLHRSQYTNIHKLANRTQKLLVSRLCGDSWPPFLDMRASL